MFNPDRNQDGIVTPEELAIARAEFYQALRETKRSESDESDRDFFSRVLDKNNDGFVSNEGDHLSRRFVKIVKGKTGKDISERAAEDILRNLADDILRGILPGI